MNGVIERAIENWLTKTNERNYQAAFCQVLMHQGHRVLHSSSHGPMEQGKDVITIGPDGECHAYQTKTGNIGLTEWRGIAGEIQELIELPVDYPGVDKSRLHKAYLVTNGSISDPVRIQINDRNEDNLRRGRQYAHLEVIGGDSLLKSFVDAQGALFRANSPTCAPFSNSIWRTVARCCRRTSCSRSWRALLLAKRLQRNRTPSTP